MKIDACLFLLTFFNSSILEEIKKSTLQREEEMVNYLSHRAIKRDYIQFLNKKIT